MSNDKKEIFKKERLPVDELEDDDSLDEVDVPSKVNKAEVAKKHERHYHSKHAPRRTSRHSHKHSHNQRIDSDPRKKADLKFKRRKEKLRVLCDQKFPAQPEAATERRSLITKNRLTRCIGIYNKGKTSDTIYREQLKSKFFSKVSDRLKEKTNEDMSKVLDCSSFQIRPLNVAASEITVDDFGQDNLSVTSSPHSTHQRTLSAASASQRIRDIHSSPASFVSTGSLNNHEKGKHSPSKTLPLKTPLTDITQRLLNSLEPMETFGRDYLQETRDELKSYYRKSSSMVHYDTHGDALPSTSTPNNAVTPVRIGSKTNPSRKLFMSSIGKIEYMSRKSAQAQLRDYHGNHETAMETDVRNEADNRERLVPSDRYDNPHVTDASELLAPNNPTLLQPFSTKEELVTMGCIANDEPFVEHRPTYDILSILDHDLRCTNEVELLSSPMYCEISPLKKPSLEIPTPPGKLLPRKLF